VLNDLLTVRPLSVTAIEPLNGFLLAVFGTFQEQAAFGLWSTWPPTLIWMLKKRPVPFSAFVPRRPLQVTVPALTAAPVSP